MAAEIAAEIAAVVKIYTLNFVQLYFIGIYTKIKAFLCHQVRLRNDSLFVEWDVTPG